MKTATSSDADQNATLSSQNNLSNTKYFWKRWRGSGGVNYKYRNNIPITGSREEGFLQLKKSVKNWKSKKVSTTFPKISDLR